MTFLCSSGPSFFGKQIDMIETIADGIQMDFHNLKAKPKLESSGLEVEVILDFQN